MYALALLRSALCFLVMSTRSPRHSISHCTTPSRDGMLRTAWGCSQCPVVGPMNCLLLRVALHDVLEIQRVGISFQCVSQSVNCVSLCWHEALP
ncbi:hypothetical protein F4819DRAFT_475942 [Hypoxylon fuscum]|nr:hypothetical protein F4819DRAFT_475942 [Hypoxylon fuscum]